LTWYFHSSFHWCRFHITLSLPLPFTPYCLHWLFLYIWFVSLLLIISHCHCLRHFHAFFDWLLRHYYCWLLLIIIIFIFFAIIFITIIRDCLRHYCFSLVYWYYLDADIFAFPIIFDYFSLVFIYAIFIIAWLLLYFFRLFHAITDCMLFHFHLAAAISRCCAALHLIHIGFQLSQIQSAITRLSAFLFSPDYAAAFRRHWHYCFFIIDTFIFIAYIESLFSFLAFITPCRFRLAAAISCFRCRFRFLYASSGFILQPGFSFFAVYITLIFHLFSFAISFHFHWLRRHIFISTPRHDFISLIFSSIIYFFIFHFSPLFHFLDYFITYFRLFDDSSAGFRHIFADIAFRHFLRHFRRFLLSFAFDFFRFHFRFAAFFQ